jgi:hypothetical protein
MVGQDGAELFVDLVVAGAESYYNHHLLVVAY